MNPKTKDLLQKLQSGDKRALSRLMTYVDNRHEDLLELMAEISKQKRTSQILGITGPPGAGKSTLVNQLIAVLRKQGHTVGVVAIDPSSPFSGGAVLGDRIRMQNHNADDGVFIRSLGSRGAHGGLSRATRDIVTLMQSFGFDRIIIETVGVGQTELDIMSVADSTVVVLVPESGDTVQTMKAGLMEIADVFVVNKADRDGADQIFGELKALSHMYSSEWEVPVLKTVAIKGEGFEELVQTLQDHTQFLEDHAKNSGETKAVLFQQGLEIALFEMADQMEKKFQDGFQENQNPYAIAQELLKKIKIS